MTREKKLFLLCSHGSSTENHEFKRLLTGDHEVKSFQVLKNKLLLSCSPVDVMTAKGVPPDLHHYIF